MDMVNGGAVTALTRGDTSITYETEIAARAALLAHWTRLGTLEAGAEVCSNYRCAVLRRQGDGCGGRRSRLT